MSKRELVDAYVSGAINRRTFVRGLIALGLSASVAAAYAVALQAMPSMSNDTSPLLDTSAPERDAESSITGIS